MRGPLAGWILVAASLLLAVEAGAQGGAPAPAAAPAPGAAPAASGEAPRPRPRPRLVPDDKASAHAGPARASGALLWSHAGDSPRPTDPAPPPFVDVLRAAGHDVFRLERPPEGDTIAAATAAVIVAARELRARGYRRVVLAGQSAGGWVSLAGVAAVPGLAEAVIATAPAAYGSRAVDATKAERNRDELLRILGAIQGARVLLFFFEGDDFDPGGRGAATAEVLGRRGVPHLVVDRPVALRGHGIGLTSGFARRFGTCILAFLDVPDPSSLACEHQPPAAVPWRFSGLPDSLPAPSNDNSPVGRFIGAWQGSLDNGDDVMLVVEGGSTTRVVAFFARGRSRAAASDQPFVQRRTGQVEHATGDLVFAPSQGLSLRARPPRGGAIEILVSASEGKRNFHGLLRPLSP